MSVSNLVNCNEKGEGVTPKNRRGEIDTFKWEFRVPESRLEGYICPKKYEISLRGCDIMVV